MVNAFGIAGSPRRQGNSATLMQAVLDGAASTGAETDSVFLDALSYRGCRACEVCSPKNKCVVNDDLPPVLDKLENSDIWVLASPVYFDSFTGQFKTFFDRCRYFIYVGGKHQRRLQGKRRAAVILTYEDKPRDDYRRLAEVIRSYLGWMGDFTDVEIICEGRLGAAGDAHSRPELLERCRETGRKLAGETS